MVAILALYGRPNDEREFLRYYAATHAPLASGLPGLQSYRHGRVYGGGEDPPSTWYAAVLTFSDRAALDAALGSDQGKKTAGDLPNFATGGVQLLFAEHGET
ncbi:MAG: EthD family reductase [Gemmatimonadales bacterium]|nr:EthD family reductase [Gemmatimonadales bacterium]